MIDNETVWIEWDGRIIAETDDAIGLESDGSTGVDLWLPKSQVGEICYIRGGDEHDVKTNEDIEALELSQWLAEKEGLI